MNQREIKDICSVALRALEDSRVMLPANSIEGVTGLKNLCREIVLGKAFVIPADTTPATEDGTEQQ